MKGCRSSDQAANFSKRETSTEVSLQIEDKVSNRDSYKTEYIVEAQALPQQLGIPPSPVTVLRREYIFGSDIFDRPASPKRRNKRSRERKNKKTTAPATPSPISL
jgi:hypothetical protein